MIFTKKRKIADITFVIFTICWIVSRLGLLPYRVLYFSVYRALEVCEMFPAYYIFNGLLCTLQILHIFWTYFMIKIVFYAIKTNEVSNFLSNFIFITIFFYHSLKICVLMMKNLLKRKLIVKIMGSMETKDLRQPK